ncbi:hypothetical protein GOBAR_AA13670 [Gossypium barbadense]|uniref:Uncharacterized protein n=1 Tax=Gossypium barbadense TaxID=3634 RepID=A0A2P5XUE6_GOSBA|nr:hypothetical protein GOBAR_AA13670 [Gossypium barbadense]
MLTKFILVSETHFQNTEIALKNQQASIQGLETQIGQLAKLISERPQGSLPSNTESNLREQLNTITIQDKKGKGEVDHSEQKPVSKEYKPQVSYLNATRKDSIDEQFVTLQARNPINTDHVVQPSLQETRKKSTHTANPRIATPEPNGTIPLTVLSIFPYGTVEVIHPKFSTFKSWSTLSNQHGRASIHTGMEEVNEVGHGRVTWPCDTAVCTNTPKGH